MPSVYSTPIPAPKPDTPVLNRDNTLTREYQDYFLQVLIRTGGVFSKILTNTQFNEQLTTLEYLAGYAFTFNGSVNINNAWQIAGSNVSSSANEINFLTGLTVPNGSVVYTNGTALRATANTGTANQILMSGSFSAPNWSTATYLPTTTQNSILYSSANNVVSEIVSQANSVLVTSATGVPSFSSNLPSAVIAANIQPAIERSWIGV